MAGALGAAFFLGAAHALTPGHGKTLVAAYLVGTKGRFADAVYLGGVVTATHTASVFILGLMTLYASQRVDLNRIASALSLVSGLLVAGIGAWLVWKRTRTTRAPAHSHPHGHPHSHTDRGSLLSLGVSGGLVPCPEALVVLMLSISAGRVILGLALLTAFTLGLAAILVAIGCAMVAAGPALGKWTGEAGWMKRLPLVSAGVVTILGIVMTLEAVRTL
jgi:nickel/cobalt transporter (NicO) family protein